jgi:hypothetical protein
VTAPRASSPSCLLAPWAFWWNRIFHDFFRIFTGSWISAQKRDTRAILLKTASVRVSCIQNTQIRGETIAKVFGKVDTFWTSHIVIRARNEKLARHLLSYQPVAARPQGKLLVIKVLLLIKYRSKALTLGEHMWSSHHCHPLRLSQFLSLWGLRFRITICVYNLQVIP